MGSGTVGIVVVAHHARLARAQDLAAHLGAHLEVDDGTRGLIPNHQAAWQWAAQQDTDWALILQDDAIPCQDFTWHLHNAVDNAPSPGIISLYAGTDKRAITRRLGTATQKAIRTGRAWVTTHRVAHGVALVAPTYWAARIASALTDPRAAYDDTLNQWAKDHLISTHYTAGSLINHHPGPSLLGHDHRGNRQAHAPRPPAQWNTRAVTL